MSFKCPHCQYENCDVQSAGEIQEKGVKFTLIVDSPEDLDRAIMVSDTATFGVKDFDIEKQPSVGQVSSVEGMLQKMAEDLLRDQALRKKKDPVTFAKIDDLIYKIKSLILGTFPATTILDDPAGNAWLERLPTDTGRKFTRESYERTPKQNKDIGIAIYEDPESPEDNPKASPDEELGGIKDGLLYSLQTQCPGCTKTTMINYHTMDIPHFKEVVISATSCEHCGYRTNNITTGGAVPEKGKRIWLEVNHPRDLQRDILKSETCALHIPECDVEVLPGSMGGRFTTVEGLLTQIRDDLHKTVFNIGEDEEVVADSLPEGKIKGWTSFFHRLDKAISGEMGFTVVLEDPFANSYVQSRNSPEPDPQIRVEEYERTEEEDEELGLADMKTRLGPDGKYVGESKDKDPEVSRESKQEAAAERLVKGSGAPGEIKGEPLEATSQPPAYVTRWLESVAKPRESDEHAAQ